jgi:RimJ/RimL family protein N-acetyltransferase
VSCGTDGAALADAARERGVGRFTATMHAENQRARRLFARVTAHVTAPASEPAAHLAA